MLPATKKNQASLGVCCTFVNRDLSGPLNLKITAKMAFEPPKIVETVYTPGNLTVRPPEKWWLRRLRSFPYWVQGNIFRGELLNFSGCIN